ncbi:MAG: hypothetical protein V7K33_32040 [Nostoc sp.]
MNHGPGTKIFLKDRKYGRILRKLWLTGAEYPKELMEEVDG